MVEGRTDLSAGAGMAGSIRRKAYVALGVLALILGLIGAVLPIVPGIPFLILSASLFAKGSKRTHRWLLDNWLLGGFIRAEYEGRPLPAVWLWLIIISIWAATALTIYFIPTALWLDALQLVIAAAFTAYFIIQDGRRGRRASP